MKTISIDVVKKNRKYFACRVNGYKAKLVIDSNSETLEIGKHELIVNDISKRTKYGTVWIHVCHNHQSNAYGGVHAEFFVCDFWEGLK